MAKTAVIAIGGNSLITDKEHQTVPDQYQACAQTCDHIASMIQRTGVHLVITHGNGPQVGAALLRSERAASEVYTHPLDVCVATTQSEIGYLIQRAMEFELREIGLLTPVMTVLTQVRVDPEDPAFQTPTKPVGPFYTKSQAEERSLRFGWKMVEDPARGFRRVVPSPQPVEVFERDIIRQILDLGMIVIAVGGGGIPVIENGYRVTGAEAVIDKDRASSLLAVDLKVDLFVISTDEEAVYVDYRKSTQRKIERATIGEMGKLSDGGHFPPGSMGPKIEAAIHYLKNGGNEVIITSYECLLDAIDGRTGTHVVQ